MLTAKKVPGRNTMVTSAMDRIWLESSPLAVAISMLVSPWDCRGQNSALIIQSRRGARKLTHCVAIAMPSTSMVHALILSSYSPIMDPILSFILIPAC